MKKLFAKIVDVKPNEVRALWLAFVFFFVVLAGYYVIRPVRDNIGASYSENLWWMFTIVLLAMIAANALFSAIVARMPRRRFIPIAYRFFIVNLLIFFVLMRWAPPGKQSGQTPFRIHRGRRFFRRNSRASHHRVARSPRQRRSVIVDLCGDAGNGGAIGAFLSSRVSHGRSTW